MAQQTTTQTNATRQAFGYILLAAGLYSLVPFAVDKSGSSQSPFIVGAGITVGYAIYTELARRRMTNENSLTYLSILQRYRSNDVAHVGLAMLLGLCALNAFDFLFFTWSTSFVDTAASSSIYELWPLTWFIAMQFVDRRRHQMNVKPTLSPMTICLMLLATVGLALIVYSTAAPNDDRATSQIPILGVSLALMAPVLGSLATLQFLFADRILYGRSATTRASWQLLKQKSISKENAEETLTHTAQALSHIFASPIVIAIAIVENGSASVLWSRAFVGGLICGIVLSGPGGALVRRAHIVSSRREVISLQYLAPVFALGWLAWLTEITVGRIDFLILGTVTIVAINMLINVDPEVVSRATDADQSDEPSSDAARDSDGIGIQARYSLKALVLSLLAFGMIIYFRDAILQGDDFIWEVGDYWSILSLASTVFALLLAFRLTRVENLLLAEDHRTFGVIRRIEMLPKAMFSNSPETNTRERLLDHIRDLNRAGRLDEYEDAYYKANSVLSNIAQQALDDSAYGYDEKREIAEIRTEIDALAHGRQYAREFAERIALWLMGGIIVALCLAVPPQYKGWPRVLAETFSVLLASVVVFMLFHLADMRRSRGNELLKSPASDTTAIAEGLYVRFQADKDYGWQRIFAGIIILGIVATLFGLLTWSSLVGV